MKRTPSGAISPGLPSSTAPRCVGGSQTALRAGHRLMTLGQPIDVETPAVTAAPRCAGAAIHPPEAIRKILDCLGLPSRAPPIASALPDREIDELNFS